MIWFCRKVLPNNKLNKPIYINKEAARKAASLLMIDFLRLFQAF